MGTVSGLPALAANTALDSLTGGWCQPHTGDPGAAGTAHQASVTTRKPLAWAAAAAGAKAITAPAEWNPWTGTTETITHISHWTAQTGGTFKGSARLATPCPVAAAGMFRLTSLTLTIGPYAAVPPATDTSTAGQAAFTVTLAAAAAATGGINAGKVTRSGTGLVLAGAPYRMIGFGMWRAAIRSWNHPGNYDGYDGSNLASDLASIHAHAPHVNAIRVWFFQQFALSTGRATGVRNWAAIDDVLTKCDAAGVKVVACLQDNWGYEYGTGHTALPGSWYTSTYSSGITNSAWETIPYRQWVSEIVTRYAGDPRILAWEPGNELNGMTTTFASDITTLIRSIDPFTPIGSGAVGTSGLYTYFDLASYHYYTVYSQTGWAADASAALAAGKCAYVGEAGLEQSLGLAARATSFGTLLGQVFAASNEVGFLAWQCPPGADSQFGIGFTDPMLPVLDTYALGTPPAGGTPTVTQIFGGGIIWSSANVVTTSTAAGDAIVVLAGTNAAVTGVTDSKGNTYVAVANDTVSDNAMFVSTYKGAPGTPTAALAAGVDTVTVTATTGGGAGVVLAVHGAAAQAADRAPAFNSGTSASPSGPATGTLAQSGDIVITAYHGSTAVVATGWGGGFVAAGSASASGAGIAAGWKQAGSTATVTPSATLATSTGWSGFTVALSPATPFRWIFTEWNIHLIYGADPATAVAALDTPACFGTLTYSAASPPAPHAYDGLAYTPVLRFTALTGTDGLNAAVTAGHTAAYDWVLYDPEWEAGGAWPTPQTEADDPWTYQRSFATAAHAAGLQVITTPARDLGNNPTSVHPKGALSLDEWYMTVWGDGDSMAKAAAASDIFVIQTQVDTGTLSAYSTLYTTCAGQAAAERSACRSWCEVSSTYPVSGDPGNVTPIVAALRSVTAPGAYFSCASASISTIAAPVLSQML